MSTLQAILAHVHERHAEHLKECDTAFDETMHWLQETLATNLKSVASQSCARLAPLPRVRPDRGDHTRCDRECPPALC